MAKKAVCISCFNNYEHRMKYVCDFLENKGFELIYITSDFEHISKQRYTLDVKNARQVHVGAYSRNLSVSRIMSHIGFAKDAFKEVEKISPDVLYVMLPPNFLAEEAHAYKKKHPNVKIIFDIYDMWPESFPYNISSALGAAFAVWRAVRDKNLCCADYIISECELFVKKLSLKKNFGEKVSVLYLTNERVSVKAPELNPEKIRLFYLGSINNIVDIEGITKLVSELNRLKPVRVEIVGDGEHSREFIESLRGSGAEIVFYGKLYDKQKLREIISQCSFGINMMRQNVVVGLSMKSIDYCRFGLPILNNLSGDTWELIDSRNAGLNLKKGGEAVVASRIASLSQNELLDMRKNVLALYEDVFSPEKLNKKLKDIFSSLDML